MKKIIFNSLILLSLLGPFQAIAGVVITGTRVVYPAADKEVSVKVNNKGNVPVLIQTWVDDGKENASPETIKVPFIITPPVNRIDAGKGQTLRLSFIRGSNLPPDRESIFWLNVLEVPPVDVSAAEANKLQVAFRSRIKLFFRPSGLKSDASTAAENIKWDVDNGKLIAINDSPYYVTLLGVKTTSGSAQGDGDMVSPYGRVSITGKKAAFSKGQSIEYQYINDWGALRKVKSSI